MQSSNLLTKKQKSLSIVTNWNGWNESSELTLANENTFVIKFDNPTSNGNDIGLGGPISITNRTFIPYGTVPGATSTGRSMRSNSSIMLYCNNTNLHKELMKNNWTMIQKVNKAIGNWNGSYHPTIQGFSNGTSLAWDGPFWRSGNSVLRCDFFSTNSWPTAQYNISNYNSASFSSSPTVWFISQYTKLTNEILVGFKIGGNKPLTRNDLTWSSVNTNIFYPEHLPNSIYVGGVPPYFVWSGDYDYLVISNELFF